MLSKSVIHPGYTGIVRARYDGCFIAGAMLSDDRIVTLKRFLDKISGDKVKEGTKLLNNIIFNLRRADDGELIR